MNVVFDIITIWLPVTITPKELIYFDLDQNIVPYVILIKFKCNILGK
jgi:hypothetical protein